MAFEETVVALLKENNELTKALIKEIKDLSLLFEKYDAEYQTEVENYGALNLG